MQLLFQALKRWWLHRLGFLHPELSNLILSLSKDQQLNAKRAENPPVSFGVQENQHTTGSRRALRLPEQRA